MISQNTSQQPSFLRSLTRSALLGASLAFLPAVFFIVLFGGISFEYGWLGLLPALTMPIAGTTVGMLYGILNYLRIREEWNKVLIDTMCAFAFVVAIWLSLIFALAQIGLWD